MEENNQIIITVAGKDKTGIVANVSNALANHKVNIEDIKQTIMQDNFVMIMLCDITKMEVSFKDFKDNLQKLGEELGIPPREAKNLKFLFAMSPQEQLGWEFIRVYALRYAGTLVPDPTEIERLTALPPEKIDREIRERPPAFAESFKLVWEQFRYRARI